jgi:VanZ family protein
VLRLAWLFGPPIAWCAAIFFLSHQPTLPSTPGGDKTAHLVAYAIMGALFARAFWFGTGWSQPALFSLAAAVSIAYGAFDEIHQYYVPGRFASWGDWVADAIGAIFGSVAFYLLARFTTLVRRDTGGGWPDRQSRSS